MVVGGGFASVEAMLALRALAGDGVRLTLVSPDRAFAYRPAATLEAFDEGPPHHYDLREIADDLHATYLCARLEAVGATNKWVRLSSGGRLQYDSLVIAIGARARVGIPGALTFRGQGDVPRFRNLLADVRKGTIKRLVFAVPSGASWPLPLYELALLSAIHAAEHGLDTDVSLVTPERTPLEMFGAEASGLVAALMSERGVRFVGGSAASEVRRDGTLALQFDPPIKADRVVAAPELQGATISGIPGNWWGFVPTDAVGRVEGLDDVYAAGDMTAFPIKHGSLATQQADRIALTIAADLGVAGRATRGDRVLRARLLGGPYPLLLRTELDQFGRPRATKLERRELDAGSGGSKVFGRYLTPYLQLQDSRRRMPVPAA
ncbi:MAG: FAD-dependent oxidoreductase [Solirubrobacteraceae bacterium]